MTLYKANTARAHERRAATTTTVKAIFTSDRLSITAFTNVVNRNYGYLCKKEVKHGTLGGKYPHTTATTQANAGIHSKAARCDSW